MRRQVVALAVLFVIAGMVMSIAAKITHQPILNHGDAVVVAALKSTFPTVATWNHDLRYDAIEVYHCMSATRNFIGDFIVAEGKGYAGKIKLGIALSSDSSTISGVRVLDQHETPGLGDDIRLPGFLTQFNELKFAPGPAPVQCVRLVKNSDSPHPDVVTSATDKRDAATSMNCQIHAISGATLSSRACVAIINRALISHAKGVRQ